jgi:hypothetical protein
MSGVGGGGGTCIPLAVTASVPSTSTYIGPFEKTEFVTVRSPAVAMEVAADEFQNPLTVMGPVLLTVALRAPSEVTLSTPVFESCTSPEKANAPKLRSPVFVSLKSPCMLEPNRVPAMRLDPFKLTEPSALKPLKPLA